MGVGVLGVVGFGGAVDVVVGGVVPTAKTGLLLPPAATAALATAACSFAALAAVAAWAAAAAAIASPAASHSFTDSDTPRFAASSHGVNAVAATAAAWPATAASTRVWPSILARTPARAPATQAFLAPAVITSAAETQAAEDGPTTSLIASLAASLATSLPAFFAALQTQGKLAYQFQGRKVRNIKRYWLP